MNQNVTLSVFLAFFDGAWDECLATLGKRKIFYFQATLLKCAAFKSNVEKFKHIFSQLFENPYFFVYECVRLFENAEIWFHL